MQQILVFVSKVFIIRSVKVKFGFQEKARFSTQRRVRAPPSPRAPSSSNPGTLCLEMLGILRPPRVGTSRSAFLFFRCVTSSRNEDRPRENTRPGPPPSPPTDMVGTNGTSRCILSVRSFAARWKPPAPLKYSCVSEKYNARYASSLTICCPAAPPAPRSPYVRGSLNAPYAGCFGISRSGTESCGYILYSYASLIPSRY